MSWARKKIDQHKRLRTPQFKQRVVPLKTVYKRKPKHAQRGDVE